VALAGDLHWERKAAGIYETVFYANGYRYRILKKENHYDTKPRWYGYYRWHKWPNNREPQWQLMRAVYSDTLKEAKEKCLKHNLKPRTKYLYRGRVTQQHVDDREHDKKYLGHHIFVPIDRYTGQPSKYTIKYISEEQYRPGKENELDEKEAS